MSAKPPAVADMRLKEWATDRQKEYLDAVEANGSMRKAALALGVHFTVIIKAIAGLKKRAARQGYAPEADMTHAVPAPLVIRGTSTMYDAEGNVKLQWVKTKLDQEQAHDAIVEWVGSLVQDIKGLAPIVPPPKHSNEDLVNVYPFGDPHFGMYAWAKECGDDFDLDIAERLTRNGFDRVLSVAPEADTALILELGDFFHADNNTNVTPRSGARLDVDTRWARVMQIGLRTMVYCVQRALAKHKKVVVRIVQGNHDPHSSFALALALDAYFHNEKRCIIDLDPSFMWYYVHGKVMIATTHGDTCKVEKLPQIMATDRPKDWGNTEHRYVYHGHIHSRNVVETPGCLIESFNTYAAKDEWHTKSGYRSARNMKCITQHKLYGEIARNVCDISMIEALKR